MLTAPLSVRAFVGRRDRVIPVVMSWQKCAAAPASSGAGRAGRAQDGTRQVTRRSGRRRTGKKVLVIDIGGTHVKLLATGETARREFDSGPSMRPGEMVVSVRRATTGWAYDVISIGYPGRVVHGRPFAEPHNLRRGWVGFDFAAAFKKPVKVINDAAMQALGSYRGGKMMFLGLGTGLGSAFIADGVLEPMELSQLPYRHGTYEDYLGIRGLKRLGKKKWRKHVERVIAELTAALEPDDVVIGGGNVRLLEKLPKGCRVGDNDNAFVGGFLLWDPHPMTAGIRRKKSVTRRQTRTGQLP
jgi:polyphosphate glucokinase